MLLPPGVRRVAHDREQPGTTLTARRTPESVEVLECAQVGLLHDILRVVVVPHQVMRQRVRGIHVRQHDRFESLELVRLQPVLEVRNTPSAKRTSPERNGGPTRAACDSVGCGIGQQTDPSQPGPTATLTLRLKLGTYDV